MQITVANLSGQTVSLSGLGLIAAYESRDFDVFPGRDQDQALDLAAMSLAGLGVTGLF